MFITRHDEGSLSRNGAFEEFVVRGVLVDYRRQRPRLNHLGMDREQLQERPQVHTGKFRSKLPTDSLVFNDDFWRHQKRYLLVSPGAKNLIRWTRKEDAGDEYIRIQSDFHLRPRTLATAASTSDLLNPALRACSLACLIKSSKASLGSGAMALRMTTSRSPTTTNWVPVRSFKRVRTSSGITTCPLEDIRVVESIDPFASFLTSKIIAQLCETVKFALAGVQKRRNREGNTFSCRGIIESHHESIRTTSGRSVTDQFNVHLFAKGLMEGFLQFIKVLRPFELDHQVMIIQDLQSCERPDRLNHL